MTGETNELEELDELIKSKKADNPPEPVELKRIILVDDLNFHLLSTKERLKKHFAIFPAHSAEEMFEIIDDVEPELILLDINMPDSNGYETIEKLHADTRYAKIPVIFLTSNTDKKSVMKGMNLGASDYITKPFTVENLVECIEYHLSPKTRDANKPIILAIDDNPSILKSIGYILGDISTVYTLPEPEKINSLLTVVVPDLFLLDCKMPVIGGFELVPIIRNHAEHDETPILFLTDEGTIDTITVAINLGASDFLLKPINEALLREKVEFHLKDFMIRRRMRSLET
jgi:DNA-binding response OmpR family regulator